MVRYVLCQGFGVFVYAFSALLSIILSLCIAINLQLVFIYNKRPDNMVVKYFTISFLVSLLLTLPPLFFDAYGYDPTGNACWYNRKYDQKFVGSDYVLLISPFKWGTYYIPAILAIGYSTFASLRVMYKLITARRLLLQSQKNQPRHSIQSTREHKNQKIIRSLVSRLVSGFYFYIDVLSAYTTYFPAV